jgi:hypothetical protein
MSPLLGDHGSIVTAIPFVVPMLVVAGGLIVLILRDRLSGDHDG